LTTPYSNNVAEYNALLIGLQLAHEMGVRYLKAYADSKLIVNQVKGESRFSMKTWYLISMQSSKWPIHFQNSKANALSALAATLALSIDVTYNLTVAARCIFCPKHVLETKKVHATSIDLEPRD